MKPVKVVATGAVSALGVGSRWQRAAPLGERAASQVRTDEELVCHGLVHARVATVPLAKGDSKDPATRFLEQAGSELFLALERCLPGFWDLRIGVAVGTSTGGMSSLLGWLEARQKGSPAPPELAARCTYHAPFAAFVDGLPVRPHRQAQLLAACASSTIAIGIGCRWLELGEVDLAICGGYDALNLLVCAGFESLAATTASTPAPFRVARDGMALGEGAALLALTMGDGKELGTDCVLGFGASCDGFHVTAPARDGALLARAAGQALEDAGLTPANVGLVSAHGTATVYNDLAEAHALSLLFSGQRRPAVDAAKAIMGHTLGASGALETVLTLDHLARQVLPAVAGTGDIIAELDARLPEVSTRAEVTNALKLSAGFGGCNATLALGSPSASARPRVRRGVRVERVGPLVTELDWQQLAQHSAVEVGKLRHADTAAELALSAALGVISGRGPLPERTAVLVASRTLGVQAAQAFYSRLVSHGVGAVAPRLFPNTSPNLCASRCSIAFALTGPCFVVDEAPQGSQHALDVCSALLESGQCEHLLLVALEQSDPVTSALFEAAGWPELRHGARALLLRVRADPRGPACLDWADLRRSSADGLGLLRAMGRLAGNGSEAEE